MSLEENKGIVRKMIEEYNKANFDILDDIVAPDYIGRLARARAKRTQAIVGLMRFVKMRSFTTWK